MLWSLPFDDDRIGKLPIVEPADDSSPRSYHADGCIAYGGWHLSPVFGDEELARMMQTIDRLHDRLADE